MTSPLTPIPFPWLRFFRYRAGMTLDDLADVSSVGKVTLSQIENGRRTPSAATKAKIAAALHMPTELVFPPEGHATPMDLLDGWVLKRHEERNGKTSHTGGLDAVVDFSKIPRGLDAVVDFGAIGPRKPRKAKR